VKPWEPFADKLPVSEHTLVLKHEQNGNGYAALTTPDGDGLWMMSSFTSKVNGVKIAIQARLVEGSEFAAPIYYIGSTKPTSIADFKKFDGTLTKKWQSFEAIEYAKGTVVVAVGYMTDKGNWIAIDNLAVKLFLNNAGGVSAQQLAPLFSNSYKFDFEKSVSPWIPIAQKFPVSEHTLVIKQEQNGNGYAALSTIDADAVAMLNSFALGPIPSNKNIDLQVTFQARNVHGSESTVPMFYLGTTKPVGFHEFKTLDPLLGDKWQTYVIEKQFLGSNLVVALGYMTDKANWAAFDNVTVKWEYR
jgi:hypothetical protein